MIVTHQTKIQGVIRFHDPAWETIQEHNAIASFIVEKGYGYPVEIIPGDTGTQEVALPAGDLDVNMELWQANVPEWYDEFVVDKKLVVDLAGTKDPVANGAKGQIIEATYVVEANPGLKSVSDLPNYIELFQDPEDPSKGLWYSCTPGAACTKRFIAKAAAYGLDETYNVLTPGSYAALAAAIQGAYTAGDPVLAYYWEPTKLLSDLDMTQLEEPAWTQACADALAAGTAEGAVCVGDRMPRCSERRPHRGHRWPGGPCPRGGGVPGQNVRWLSSPGRPSGLEERQQQDLARGGYLLYSQQRRPGEGLDGQ